MGWFANIICISLDLESAKLHSLLHPSSELETDILKTASSIKLVRKDICFFNKTCSDRRVVKNQVVDHQSV